MESMAFRLLSWLRAQRTHTADQRRHQWILEHLLTVRTHLENVRFRFLSPRICMHTKRWFPRPIQRREHRTTCSPHILPHPHIRRKSHFSFRLSASSTTNDYSFSVGTAARVFSPNCVPSIRASRCGYIGPEFPGSSCGDGRSQKDIPVRTKSTHPIS